MHYYAVIDTNVLVSALLKINSLPGIIMELIKVGLIIPIINEDIVDEYLDVLKRDKFPFTFKQINNYINLFEYYGMFLKPIKSNKEFIDKKDKKFYELFLKANELNYSYLITGNLKHFPKEDNILNPREFLEKIGFLNK